MFSIFYVSITERATCIHRRVGEAGGPTLSYHTSSPSCPRGGWTLFWNCWEAANFERCFLVGFFIIFFTRNGFWEDVTWTVVDIFFGRRSPKDRFFVIRTSSQPQEKFCRRVYVRKAPTKWIKQAAERIRINPQKRSPTTMRVKTRSWYVCSLISCRSRVNYVRSSVTLGNPTSKGHWRSHARETCRDSEVGGSFGPARL